jgi:hypothetical protein
MALEMDNQARHLASLKQRLEAEGLRVGYGDTTTGSGAQDPHYLLTIFPIDGEDGLWVMDDWGLTPVVHRAYRTRRMGTVDPEAVTLGEAVWDIKQLLHAERTNDSSARAVHSNDDGATGGTQSARTENGHSRPEEE